MFLWPVILCRFCIPFPGICPIKGQKTEIRSVTNQDRLVGTHAEGWARRLRGVADINIEHQVQVVGQIVVLTQAHPHIIRRKGHPAAAEAIGMSLEQNVLAGSAGVQNGVVIGHQGVGLIHAGVRAHHQMDWSGGDVAAEEEIWALFLMDDKVADRLEVAGVGGPQAGV